MGRGFCWSAEDPIRVCGPNNNNKESFFRSKGSRALTFASRLGGHLRYVYCLEIRLRLLFAGVFVLFFIVLVQLGVAGERWELDSVGKSYWTRHKTEVDIDLQGVATVMFFFCVLISLDLTVHQQGGRKGIHNTSLFCFKLENFEQSKTTTTAWQVVEWF